MDYIEDIIRSGMAERAVLIKRPFTNDEYGDPVYRDEDEERYEFKTVVDSLDRAENELEAGDFIEGDLRFYVSEGCVLDFEHGDFVEYKDREYNITEVRTKTLGQTASHREVIVENV